MVRYEVIHKRMRKLTEYLLILKDLQKYSYEQFHKEPTIYGSCERFLHLAIEATLDIGNHLVSDLNLGVVNKYRDIPETLFNHNYISNDLKKTWIQIIGFRNTLVHDYIDIDKKIIFHILHNNLDDFNRLKKFFADFL